MPLGDLHDSSVVVQYIYVTGLHAFGRPKNVPIFSVPLGNKKELNSIYVGENDILRYLTLFFVFLYRSLPILL